MKHCITSSRAASSPIVPCPFRDRHSDVTPTAKTPPRGGGRTEPSRLDRHRGVGSIHRIESPNEFGGGAPDAGPSRSSTRDSRDPERSGIDVLGAGALAVITLVAWVGLPTAAQTYEFSDELSVGGRIFADAAWFSPGYNADFTDGPRADNGVEFRRVRLFASGTFEDRLAYKLQFDFAGGEAALKDAYLRMDGIPAIGSVKAGHFKEPFSIEDLTSSNFLLLLERAMIVDAFSPARNTGIEVGTSHLDDRFTWRAGAFRPADGFGTFVGGRAGAVTGRVTGLPWRNGDDLLHLGLAYSRRTPPSRTLEEGTRGRFFDPGSRPEAHLAPTAVELPGSGVSTAAIDLFGAELASIVGPATLTAESMAAHLEPTDPGAFDHDPILWGWNAAASVFATGETRPYDGGRGTLSRPEPAASFLTGGPGAWELVLRYSQLDLREAEGGALANVTAGVNWYWNRRARMMLNYGYGTAKLAGDPSGPETQSAQMRLQINF